MIAPIQPATSQPISVAIIVPDAGENAHPAADRPAQLRAEADHQIGDIAARQHLPHSHGAREIIRS